MMEINLSEEIKKNTTLSTVVISCLTDTITKELMAGRTKKGVVCDIKLTVAGHELDFRALIERWQKQISRMVKEKAAEIVKEKFSDIYDTLADLEDRLKTEVEKRLEDWERE